MDVHIPLAITEGLRRRVIDGLTAQHDGADRLEDDLLLQCATSLERALFCQAEDLLAIAAAYQAKNVDFSGLI
jgi:hypothetical protein